MSIRVKSEKDLYLYLNEIYIMGISMRDIDVTTLSQLGYNVYESFGFIEINETALKTNLKNLSEVHRLACDSMICCCIDGELTLEINERTFTIQSGMFIISETSNTLRDLFCSKRLLSAITKSTIHCRALRPLACLISTVRYLEVTQ